VRGDIEFSLLRQIVDKWLVFERAQPLSIAKPPFSPGVYALFFEGERVYVGVARGNKGLRNRKRNYVGGGDGHTTHREFLSIIPDKVARTAFIKVNVSMAWHVTETAAVAEELEKMLISFLRPKWNRLL
jgi:excinuclease UvrABC nuclease subunit